MKPVRPIVEMFACMMALTALPALGCESFDPAMDDSDQAARSSSFGELIYHEWERRPQPLWGESVEAPSLILFKAIDEETERVQLLVFGVDASRGLADFALIALPEQYREVMAVAAEQGLSNGISAVGVPNNIPLPPSPGPAPDGNPSERLVEYIVTFAKKQHILAKEFAAGFPED